MRTAVSRIMTWAVLLGVVACSTSKPAEEAAPEPVIPVLEPDSKLATYKGYEAINEALRSRVVAEPESFQLSRYLGAAGGELSTLLGTWRGVGLRNQFGNATPNTMSFVIWRVAFSGVGQDLARHCTPGADGYQIKKLQPRTAQALATLCHWPDTAARHDEVLEAFWLALAGYDAPVEEYEAWRTHFQGEAYRQMPAAEVIPLMVSALFLNPHVLLRD
jgi:hypothetical protein